MTDWRTLTDDNLSPERARSISRKPKIVARHQKVVWNGSAAELENQILTVKQELAKIELILNPSYQKDVTAEQFTKLSKRQVTLKKKLDQLTNTAAALADQKIAAEKISILNKKIAENRTELIKLEKFMTDPFVQTRPASPDKQMWNKRRLLWEEAAKKKSGLEKEQSVLYKKISELTNDFNAARGRKRKW
jgi:hypothetical protein